MKSLLKSGFLLSLSVFVACGSVENPTSVQPNDEPVRLKKIRLAAEEHRGGIEAFSEKMRQRIAERKVVLARRTADKILHGSKITVPDDFPTIQQAVDAAAPGTKIKVKAGTYNEYVIVTTDDIELTAEGEVIMRDAVFFDGVSGGSVNKFHFDNVQIGVLIASSDGVEVEDNSFEHCASVIALELATNCKVKGNTSFNASRDVVLSVSSGNRIEDNHFVEGEFSIFLQLWSNDNEISGNTILQADDVGIILLNNCENNELKDNVVSDAEQATGILLYNTDHNEVGSDNKINNNYRGIDVFNSSGNVIKKNEATGNSDCDIIQAGGVNTFIKNDADCISGFE